MLFAENFFSFREKYHISGNFFGISGNILGKNVTYPENVFGMSGNFFLRLPPPPRKVPLKAWPPQLLEGSYAPAAY
jgi:hypothetical protein